MKVCDRLREKNACRCKKIVFPIQSTDLNTCCLIFFVITLPTQDELEFKRQFNRTVV